MAIAGSLFSWLKDNLGVIDSIEDVEGLAQTVDDSGGVFFVPAFSGLLAPHWRTDARGVIVGLTGMRQVNRKIQEWVGQDTQPRHTLFVPLWMQSVFKHRKSWKL